MYSTAHSLSIQKKEKTVCFFVLVHAENLYRYICTIQHTLSLFKQKKKQHNGRKILYAYTQYTLATTCAPRLLLRIDSLFLLKLWLVYYFYWNC